MVMIEPLSISNSSDLADCRRKAAALSEAAGLGRGLQTRLVTAVSELCRAMLMHCSGVVATFELGDNRNPFIRVSGRTPLTPRHIPPEIPSLEQSARAAGRLVQVASLPDSGSGMVGFQLGVSGASWQAPMARAVAALPAADFGRSLASASVGLWCWSESTDTLWLDPAAQAVLGLGDGGVPLSTCLDVVHPGEAAVLAAGIRGGNVETVVRCVLSDGVVRRVWLRGARTGSDAGTVAGVCLDVTGFQALQQMRLDQGRQRLESMGELAGAMAHEINNLLQPILGIVEMMRDDARAGQVADDDLAVVADCARQAAAIIRDVLIFARQDDVVGTQPVQCVAAVQSALRFIRPLLPPSVTLSVDLPEGDEGLVCLRPTDMQQALTNLVTNAAHAMDWAGVVRLVAARRTVAPMDAERLKIEPGSYFAVSVSDQGNGMDPETELLIFEPFFTTKPVGQGTGLGLSVVFGITRGCGGTVTVETQQGNGSTFTLYFPLQAE